MDINSFQDLKVWQLDVEIVEQIYRITEAFPKAETYGLTSQIRRAAVSIPANIAEGHGRDSTIEFLYHLSVARGSLAELHTELVIAQRLSFASESDGGALFPCSMN